MSDPTTPGEESLEVWKERASTLQDQLAEKREDYYRTCNDLKNCQYKYEDAIKAQAVFEERLRYEQATTARLVKMIMLLLGKEDTPIAHPYEPSNRVECESVIDMAGIGIFNR